MVVAWLMLATAAASAAHRVAEHGADPLYVAFCNADWVALADLTLLDTRPMPWASSLRVDVGEVLVVRGRVTIPAQLMAPVDGAAVQAGRSLVLKRAESGTKQGFFFAGRPVGSRQIHWTRSSYVRPYWLESPPWEMQYERFFSLPDEESWTWSVSHEPGDGRPWLPRPVRARKYVTVVNSRSFDEIVADIRRLAPRLTDLRKRRRYCQGFYRPLRRWFPDWDGERPARGVDLVPPEPVDFPPLVRTRTEWRPGR